MSEAVFLKKRRPNAFIKVSGDEFQNGAFIEWVRELCGECWVVVCVGGGTQINQAFEAGGFPVKTHGPLGREMETFEERQLHRNILEQNQAALQDMLHERGIYAAVEIPYVIIGTVLCPVNGDQMVRTVYLGYDRLFVITMPQRLEKKKADFADLPRVEVVAF